MSDIDPALALWLIVAIVASSRSAHAGEPTVADQPYVVQPADASAVAQGLFLEGRRLVAEGRYSEACAKLEQSKRLDPAAGTSVNLADCYEKIGKLAMALLAFREAATAARSSGRTQWAEQADVRAKLLEPRVPMLTLVVEDRPPGLEVRCGSARVDSPALGLPVPVDPGTYNIAAMAPGRRRWWTGIALEEGAHVVLHIPALDEAERPSPRAVFASARPAIGSRPARPAPALSQRTIGLGLSALAVAPLAVGTYFGVMAIARNERASALCPTPPQCADIRALAFDADARHAAAVSNVAFITAATMGASGLVLLLSRPTKSMNGNSVTMGIEAGALSLAGQF